MTPAQRLRATYEFKSVDHLFRKDFYIWNEALERWKTEGLPDDWKEQNVFNFDGSAEISAGQHLGWCEPPFLPKFEEKVIRTEGETEIFQDWAGRWLQCFKGRRHGFMPDYIRHPVSSEKDWEENCRWRLNPNDARRYEDVEARCGRAADVRRSEGRMVTQGFVGGYMYLRALVGPEELLYMFYDRPGLVHAMMRQWCEVMDEGFARIQKHIELDKVLIGEDICYNHGLLISPEMVREFLFPYYQQVLSSARARQGRKFHLLIDTDGLCYPAVDLYREIGMTAMMPWEVACGCDVVEAGRRWPDLVIEGGIDKRVLAADKEAIAAHVRHVIPAMLKRGGYIPMCDHGVPDNVSLGNYLYYRQLVCEMDH